MKFLDADKYKITYIILQKKDNISKLEYMFNVNSWMEQSFAACYQGLCEFSNQAIQYFLHQSMLSPTNAVVMEETSSFMFKVTQETPSEKKKLERVITLKGMQVYYMVAIILIRVIYSYNTKLLSSLMECS